MGVAAPAVFVGIVVAEMMAVVLDIVVDTVLDVLDILEEVEVLGSIFS